PILDSHWMEAMLLIISAVTLSGDTWGVGKIWGRMVGNGWLR
nr:DoxX family protein [Actinomycetales bacterium]